VSAANGLIERDAHAGGEHGENQAEAEEELVGDTHRQVRSKRL
jgi:hypothetical protein